MESLFFDALEHHRPHVLVVGDLMIDHYVWGESDRISPEAPVPIIEVKNENRRLGGACNVMHNLLALGGFIIPCGVVGNDAVGLEIRSKLTALGLRTDGVITEEQRLSTQKTRVIASHQQVVRVDWEQRKDINLSTQESIFDFVYSHITDVDCIILSDYAKGVLTPSLTQKIIKLANQRNVFIFADPKGDDYSKYKGATLITPNLKEAQKATGLKILSSDEHSLLKGLQQLNEHCQLRYPLITLSEDGIALLYNDTVHKIPTITKEVYDVTGAGDTVIAALAFVLCFSEDIIKAAQFANAAAAVVVSKIGSATANLLEIRHYAHVSNNTGKHVLYENLENLVKNLRDDSKKIVWTNGCFDILHYGHVSYLQEARSFGDVLIVGINSDDSVRKLKGETRPINTLADRLGILCALSAVDFVISFDEETPFELIRIVKPDILVKGEDYQGHEIIGSEFAQQVRFAKLKVGRSTTAIIKSIKENFKKEFNAD